MLRNYHTRRGEIDIIAEKGDKVAFVEVKTRSNLKYDYPQTAVDYRKQQRIRTAALQWLQEERSGFYREISFDVVAILVGEKQKDGRRTAGIKWFPACF